MLLNRMKKTHGIVETMFRAICMALVLSLLGAELALPIAANAATSSDTEKVQQRLTHRYANPVVGRFIRNVSSQQALQLYVEASRLIDTRHLEPSAYSARVKTAANNLMQAVGNRAFLDANGISPSRRQVATFRSEMQRLLARQRIRTSGDALNMMYSTMNIAGRHVGVRQTTVAMEFVYSAAETLDKYSGFVPLETARQPSAVVEDHVVGIGVEIKPHDLGVLVLKTLRGGPAAAGGLKKGDLITSANGKKLKGKNLDYAADAIAGPVGSRLILGIRRNGKRISPITLVRRRVEIYSVSEVRLLADNPTTGYIKLDRFAKTSSDEVDAALWNLYRKGMKSLVIDVRGNPGGLLTTAIELSNKFLPCGSIVSTRGRNADDNSKEVATHQQTWKLPLVVLVDGNSASASEIFAAAIQENGRGLVVGRQSYGKGSVQTHFSLQSVSANLRLTTAKFYSPKGRKMAGAGVEPDIHVSLPKTEVTTGIDRDVEAAIAATKDQQLRNLAMAHSGCRGGVHRDLSL